MLSLTNKFDLVIATISTSVVNAPAAAVAGVLFPVITLAGLFSSTRIFVDNQNDIPARSRTVDIGVSIAQVGEYGSALPSA